MLSIVAPSSTPDSGTNNQENNTPLIVALLSIPDSGTTDQ